ncbi:MAG: endonuclease/exonuclease/phosphatase family protein [Gammaproteobacteria bacterium]|nr:endonuclease/exonuclease/phosphatase family protein [Gammaproteobacteria bacterium]
MLGRIETLLRRLRRNLSRSVWLARLLHLPVSAGASTRAGLILIQIDGLSQPQLEQALAHNEMPFLQRLIRREHYQQHTLYSGLPSTTPAVQAELFYGIKGAVPAFAYRDHASRQLVRMFEPVAAARIEALLAHSGNEALLRGGSAYANVFTGGAAEPHFCPAAMGWGPALRGVNPLVLLAFVLSNLYSFLRIALLLLLEVGLALWDFVRGLVGGHNLAKELKFIPTRVAIAILLRELCVIGGKIDISRGLPVIHLNFLGYDEQSHRRGPHSLFAHWSLKGIDDAITRLWRAANHSAWRHYDVWIYSDHGQVPVQSYHQQQGYSLKEAVATVFAQLRSTPTGGGNHTSDTIQTQRVRLLGGAGFQHLFSVLGMSGENGTGPLPLVAGLGPVAHIYAPQPLSAEEREVVVHELVQRHKVPLVLTMKRPHRLCAYTAAGEFQLPRDRAMVFGPQHPFLDALGEDLQRLCTHPDAGDFTLLGWCDGVTPLTFAEENGAHAGATPEETNAFALLPADTRLATRTMPYLRPGQLREAALHHLGRPTTQRHDAPLRSATSRTDTLRIMTYNVHGCVGMDGKLDVERIARVIARARPDVVALQELDVGRVRSDSMDQAHLIARYLEMDFHFHPALHLAEERYGDAILTHLPLRLVKAKLLPGLAQRPRLEPRGALWVAIDLHGTEVQVINTHLGLYPSERLAQVEALLGRDWLADERCQDPVILCGDFNALPSSPICRHLATRLSDVQIAAPQHRPKGTFSSRFPRVRIDHIFIGPRLEARHIEVPATELARVASDHLPLLAELRLRSKGKASCGEGLDPFCDWPE